jgi:hypothetical protein
MSRIDRKRIKLHDQIIALEDHLRMSRKDSSKTAVEAKLVHQLADLKAQLAA